MPYSDPEKQRQAQAESYRRRYASRKFRHEEAERKAAWLETEEGRKKNLEATKRYQRKVKLSREPPTKKRGKKKVARLRARSSRKGISHAGNE